MAYDTVTVTWTLSEFAVVMGAIDKSLIDQGTDITDTTMVLAIAGTKLTDAFKNRAE